MSSLCLVILCTGCDWLLTGLSSDHSGLGLALTAGSAYYLHKTGVSARIMSANPWVVLGGGLVFSIGSMYGVFNTRVESEFSASVLSVVHR
jgi:hypothetical protein